MSLQGEIEYPLKANAQHLRSKPFSDPRAFREFTLVLDLIRSAYPTGKLLDIGCGPGWTSVLLATAGYHVTAVDVAPAMIDILQAQAQQRSVAVDCVVADASQLELPAQDYDVALFFDALHHFPNYGLALQRAYDHLAPGGMILLMEPSWLHRHSPHAKRAAQKYDVTELGFSRRELQHALGDAGFRNVLHFHDPGPVYRGWGGFLATLGAAVADFVTAFPKRKRICTALK